MWRWLWLIIAIIAAIIAYRVPVVVDPSLLQCDNLVVLEQRNPSDFLPGICRVMFVQQQEVLSAVYDCGPSTGREDSIVLIHGFPDNAKTWKRQVETFIQNGYRVLIPRLRGYDAYSKSSEFHVTVLANDILCIMKALEIESYHIIGHDWGAIIGHVLAITNYRFVESFISVSVPPIYTAQAGKIMLGYPQQFLNSFYMLLFQLPIVPELLINHTPFLYYLYARWSPTYAWHSDSHFKEVEEMFQTKSVTHAALHYYRQNIPYLLLDGTVGKFFDSSSQATHPIRGRASVNTLLITGKDDQCIITELYDLPMDQFFRSTYEVHRMDGGHFVHYENWKVFNEVALGFIKKSSPIVPKSRITFDD